MARYNRKWIQILGLSLVTALVLGPSLTSEFLWDDFTYVVQNSLLQGSDSLFRIWLTRESADFWPLSYSFFWIETKLFGQNPLGYHVVNLLLHLGNVVLVFLLVSRWFSRAWWIALLFAVHPLGVDSVVWIVQAKTTLSTLLGLLSLLFYVKWREESGIATYGLSLFFFAASLLAKTHLVLLPVALWICESFLPSISRKSVRRATLRLLPYFLISAVMGWVALGWYDGPTDFSWGERSFADQFFGQFYLSGLHVQHVLTPHNLRFSYGDWTTVTFGWKTVVLAIFGASTILGSLFCLVRGSAQVRRLGAAGVCYFVILFPVLGWIRIYFMKYSVAADHWQYPIYAIPILVLIEAAHMGFENSRTLRSVLPVVALVLGGLTIWHARNYRSEVALWQSVLDHDPKSLLALNNMGIVLEKSGDIDRAQSYFLEVLKLNPNDVEANNSHGAYLLNSGRTTEAVSFIEKSVQANPLAVNSLYNLALAYGQIGRTDESISLYMRAIRLNPKMSIAYNNLALTYSKLGRAAEARAILEEALRNESADGKIHFNLGSILESLGDRKAAREHYVKAFEFLPNDPLVRSKATGN